MKICIICQVQDSKEYIPAWLAWHLNLVDKIYLIDHRSKRDLRNLMIDEPKLEVLRSNTEHFVPEININALLAHKEIYKKYDWVFVLDIDEFLDFQSRSEILNFCKKNKFFAGVSLYWKNGISVSKHKTERINGDTNFLFDKSHSATRKFCYHTAKRRQFWIGHGNHGARFPLLGIPFLNLRPLLNKGQNTLYHVPFFDLEYLKKKIDTFPKDKFAHKFHPLSNNIIDKYDSFDATNKICQDDIVWFVINYRENKHFREIQEIELYETVLFQMQSDEIQIWATKIDNCKIDNTKSDSSFDANAIKRIRKGSRYRYKKTILQYTQILKDNSLNFALPN